LTLEIATLRMDFFQSLETLLRIFFFGDILINDVFKRILLTVGVDIDLMRMIDWWFISWGGLIVRGEC
jgi:hypothetical protein